MTTMSAADRPPPCTTSQARGDRHSRSMTLKGIILEGSPAGRRSVDGQAATGLLEFSASSEVGLWASPERLTEPRRRVAGRSSSEVGLWASLERLTAPGRWVAGRSFAAVGLWASLERLMAPGRRMADGSFPDAGSQRRWFSVSATQGEDSPRLGGASPESLQLLRTRHGAFACRRESLARHRERAAGGGPREKGRPACRSGKLQAETTGTTRCGDALWNRAGLLRR